MDCNHTVRSLFVDTTNHSHTHTKGHEVTSHAFQPPPLSPMCGWQKSGTPSPGAPSPSSRKNSVVQTPTKPQRQVCAAHRASPLHGTALLVQSSPTLLRTLEPYSWSTENSPAKLDRSSDPSEGHSSARAVFSPYCEDVNETITFRVPDIKLNDLYDWDEKLSEGNSRLASDQPSSCHTGVKINLNQEDIALFRKGGPLELGDLEELAAPGSHSCLGVRCPWHGWTFDLATGATIRPVGLGARSASVYKTSVEQDGSILIHFAVLNSAYFNDVRE